MPALLSRIEREFVLKSLVENPQPLAVYAGGQLLNLATEAYEIRGELILVPRSCLDPAKMRAGQAVSGEPEIDFRSTVYFRHRKRGMYFHTEIREGEDGRFRFSIPDHIYLEHMPSTPKAACTLSLDFGDRECRAGSDAAYPPFTVIPDPQILRDRKETLESLSARIGLEDSGFFLSYRMYEFAERTRTKGRPAQAGNVLLFVDHRYIIACLNMDSLGLSVDELRRQNETLRARLVHENRQISVSASVRGSMPLTSRDCMVGFEIVDAQPEDTRFLFESAYREKFRG